ncbi:DUF5610 domain-containing protein [Neptuniibacter halophilus]|uniref:DUF5610 domain-containing protein n=1 Tax=Neptuniibacter halophilus TaxID=651666 RepID=UPI0025745CC3|nr:DUF5610 domain-containing protein [Neptuniibacter halophilus]
MEADRSALHHASIATAGPSAKATFELTMHVFAQPHIQKRKRRVGLYTLLFTKLSEQFNEMFEPELDRPALDTSPDVGSELSAEDLINRFTDMISGLYVSFTDHHPEMLEDIALERFLNLSYEGLHQGLEEATVLLDSQGLLDDERNTQLETLHEQLEECLESFSQNFGYDCYDPDGAEADEYVTAEEDELLDEETLDRLLM